MRRQIISLTVATSLTSVKSLAYSTQNHQTFVRKFCATTPILLISTVASTCGSGSQGSVLLPNNSKHYHYGSSTSCMMNMDSSSTGVPSIDPEYPGTANVRLRSVLKRVSELTRDDLDGDWEDVRRKLLWAGGLKDLPNAIPGQGYTGHSFNDYNHVDLTTMSENVSNNENDGKVSEIAIGNNLHSGIRLASLPELGPGGSWSTCANGCHVDPPQDVAHVQFRSRIAFKLVWVPNEDYDQFVLVDDYGNELARGKPTGNLPMLHQRKLNYRLVSNSKYSEAADRIVSELSAP